jgi:hypothetical protein
VKFALLGDVPDVLPLVRAIGESEHELVLAVRTGAATEEIMWAAPGARLSDDTAEVLTLAGLDAAIVAGWDAGVLVAARQLAGTGVPLVLLPDVRQDTAYVYELTLARNDTGVPLVPLVPRLVHPRWHRLRDVLRGPAFGGVQWCRWERERPLDAAAGFTTEQIEAALLADVAVLRFLGGDFDRVTALPSTNAAGQITASTVTLAGPDRPEVTWGLRAGETARWRLEIVSSAGRWEFSGTDDPALVVGPGGFFEGPERVGPGPAMLARVVHSLRSDHVVGEPVDDVLPTWTDTVRDFEIVDGARRSVRRRRTIDLLFETTSERNQFKSQMAAGGCGVLLYALFALIAAAALNTLGDLPVAWRRGATLLLFLPVFAFLALQLLYFVARPAGDSGG